MQLMTARRVSEQLWIKMRDIVHETAKEDIPLRSRQKRLWFQRMHLRSQRSEEKKKAKGKQKEWSRLKNA